MKKQSIPLYEIKGELYKMKAEWEMEEGKNFEETLKSGISELDRIIKEKKGSASIYALSGYFYYLIGKGNKDKSYLEKAKENIKKAISLNPKIEENYGFILK